MEKFETSNFEKIAANFFIRCSMGLLLFKTTTGYTAANIRNGILALDKEESTSN